MDSWGNTAPQRKIKGLLAKGRKWMLISESTIPHPVYCAHGKPLSWKSDHLGLSFSVLAGCWLWQACHSLLVLFSSSVKWRNGLEILGFLLSAKFKDFYVHTSCQYNLKVSTQVDSFFKILTGKKNLKWTWESCSQGSRKIQGWISRRWTMVAMVAIKLRFSRWAKTRVTMLAV